MTPAMMIANKKRLRRGGEKTKKDLPRARVYAMTVKVSTGEESQQPEISVSYINDPTL